MGRLHQRVAFITGAGRGIGRAIAHKCAAEGASVVIAEMDSSTARTVAGELTAAGHAALAVPTDITRESDVQHAIAQTIAAFGGLDILVNNAGQTFHDDATTMTESAWDAAMAVDLKGVWFCCKYALPHLIERGGGSIINLASVHARHTAPDYFPYGAAKAAVVGLTRSLALDYGPRAVRVNAVSPGWVLTEQVQSQIAAMPDPQAFLDRVLSLQPVRRLGTPADIANLVAFLASDEAAYINGAEIVIDGGLTAQFPQ